MHRALDEFRGAKRCAATDRVKRQRNRKSVAQPPLPALAAARRGRRGGESVGTDSRVLRLAGAVNAPANASGE